MVVGKPLKVHIEQEARKRKSTTQWVGETILFAVIGTILIFGIWYVIKWLFIDPLVYIFLPKEFALAREREMEIKRKKKWAEWRKEKKEQYSEELTRYENKDKYADWKAGKVIDSQLKWEPDDLIERAGYLRIQYNFHENANFIRQYSFLKALDMPTMGDAKVYIDYLCDEAKEEELKEDLTDKLVGLGLSKRVAEYIANSDVSADDIIEVAKKINLYSKSKYRDETLMAVFVDYQTWKDEKEVSILTDEEISRIDKIIRAGIENVNLSYGIVRGIISKDDALEIYGNGLRHKANNEDNGLEPGDEGYVDMDNFINKTYQEYMSAWMKGNKRKRLEEETGKKVWTKRKK